MQEKNRRSIFTNLPFSTLFVYGLTAAILYCIPLFIFIKTATFSSLWLLYLGNALFLGCMFLFIPAFFRKMRSDNASTPSTLIAGHGATIIGVILSCLFAFIMLMIMVPDMFSGNHSEDAMANTPANMVHGPTNGLIFTIFISAIIGNFAAGSFVTLITAYTAKRDQTGDSAERL
ncbi:MAG: hypothetical protein JWN76_1300 [Chitinophagaceae bacterium]|nr:hypothetical protein [Chitinophagaceae bacterium]